MTYLIIPSMIFIVTSSKLLSFFFILSSVLLTTFDKLEYMELLVFLFTDFSHGKSLDLLLKYCATTRQAICCLVCNLMTVYTVWFSRC